MDVHIRGCVLLHVLRTSKVGPPEDQGERTGNSRLGPREGQKRRLQVKTARASQCKLRGSCCILNICAYALVALPVT